MNKLEKTQVIIGLGRQLILDLSNELHSSLERINTLTDPENDTAVFKEIDSIIKEVEKQISLLKTILENTKNDNS
jgi:hypothetical protein